MFIQQSVKHDKDKYVKGTYVVSSKDPEYLKELERRVDDGTEMAAFSMYPTSMDELFEVADAGKLMPPKSTWFEPKLLSGLFIHKL